MKALAIDGTTAGAALRKQPWMPRWLPWLAGVVVFLFLACDFRLHQDEPGYLFIGTYLSWHDLLTGDFQPSGIVGQYLSRLLHLLFIRSVSEVVGPGISGLVTIIATYLVLWLASARLGYQVLLNFMAARLAKSGIALVMFVPVYLYFAFKTSPEIPGFFFTALACFASLRSLRGRFAFWVGVAAASLTAVAFTKNHLALMWVALIIALLVIPPFGIARIRLVTGSIASAGVALIASLLLMLALGIDIAKYVGVGAAAMDRNDPLPVMLLNIGLEGGIFFLALPIAFLSRRKRLAAFFLLWFLLASVPLLVIFGYVEHRYLVSNLFAFAGLLALATDAVAPAFSRLWSQHPLLWAGITALSLVSIISSSIVALAIAAHEVRMDQMARIISQLDRRYGSDYALLVPWAFTDFHYLRYVYPSRDVYTVQTLFPDHEPSRAEFERRMEDREYGAHFVRSRTQLAAVHKKLVYVGFHETFSVANFRDIAASIPLLRLERQLSSFEFMDHIALSWMWHNPQVKFNEKFQVGYYHVYAVELLDSSVSNRTIARR